MDALQHVSLLSFVSESLILYTIYEKPLQSNWIFFFFQLNTLWPTAVEEPFAERKRDLWNYRRNIINEHTQTIFSWWESIIESSLSHTAVGNYYYVIIYQCERAVLYVRAEIFPVRLSDIAPSNIIQEVVGLQVSPVRWRFLLPHRLEKPFQFHTDVGTKHAKAIGGFKDTVCVHTNHHHRISQLSRPNRLRILMMICRLLFSSSRWQMARASVPTHRQPANESNERLFRYLL